MWSINGLAFDYEWTLVKIADLDKYVIICPKLDLCARIKLLWFWKPPWICGSSGKVNSVLEGWGQAEGASNCTFLKLSLLYNFSIHSSGPNKHVLMPNLFTKKFQQHASFYLSYGPLEYPRASPHLRCIMARDSIMNGMRKLKMSADFFANIPWYL